MTDPNQTANDAVKITADLVERMIVSVVDGTDLGNAAATFLREKRDTLIGLSVSALQDVFGQLGQAAGSHTAVLDARHRFIDAMTFQEALAFQQASVDQLEKHTNEKFRAGSFFQTVGQLAQAVAPKVIGAVLSMI